MNREKMKLFSLVLNRIGLISLILPVLVSCVHENYDDCPPLEYDYTLVFYYPGDGTADIFPAKIENVDLFLFDSSGLLTSTSSYSRQELEIFQGATLSVPAGEYTVVCWGNPDRYSEYTGGDNPVDKRIYQSQYLTGQTIENFDSLYFGRRDIVILPTDTARDTVTFRSAHINMQIYVEGYREFLDTRAEGQGLIRLNNIFVGYDFAMNVTGEKSTIYPRWRSDVTDTIALAEFNLLRFGDDTDITIDILDGNSEIVTTIVLREFLAEHGISVEGVNEITVPIYILFEGTYVHVSIAEWGTEDVKPIF